MLTSMCYSSEATWAFVVVVRSFRSNVPATVCFQKSNPVFGFYGSIISHITLLPLTTKVLQLLALNRVARRFCPRIFWQGGTENSLSLVRA